MKQSELKLMSIMSAAFSRLKMSPVQIAILSCIGLNPGIRFGEIANRVSVSSSRLCFHLNTLAVQETFLPPNMEADSKKVISSRHKGVNAWKTLSHER